MKRSVQKEMSEQEFIESFREYGDAIFRFCLLKVSDVALAEDMAQETFTRYWQALRDGKEMTNTRSFLYTIANNMAKDWYKKKKADSLDARMEQTGEPAGPGVSPEADAAHKEVLEVIQNMDEGDREVLLLRHVEGLMPKDIAAITGERVNTISVRINRATARLKEKLHTQTERYG